MYGLRHGARILFYPEDKKQSSRAANLIEDISHAISLGANVISLSASLKTIINNEEELEKINALLAENGVTLIDSDKFYEDFTYSYRDVDEKEQVETLEESFCEPEDSHFENIWFNVKSSVKGLMSEYRVTTVEELKQSLKKDQRLDLLRLVEEFEPIIGQDKFSDGPNSPLHFLKQRSKNREKLSRTNLKSVEIPCAGRTLNGKYLGTSSASYTIPVVAGMFAMSKQINLNVSYEEFVKIARETSKEVDGRYVVQPKELFERVMQYEKTLIDSLKSEVNQEVTNQEIEMYTEEGIQQKQEEKEIE